MPSLQKFCSKHTVFVSHFYFAQCFALIFLGFAQHFTKPKFWSGAQKFGRQNPEPKFGPHGAQKKHCFEVTISVRVGEMVGKNEVEGEMDGE